MFLFLLLFFNFEKNLIEFQIFVNATHKHETAVPTDRAEHDKEKVANDKHVAKVKRSLQHAVHLRTIQIKENRIQVDKE